MPKFRSSRTKQTPFRTKVLFLISIFTIAFLFLVIVGSTNQNLSYKSNAALRSTAACLEEQVNQSSLQNEYDSRCKSSTQAQCAEWSRDLSALKKKFETNQYLYIQYKCDHKNYTNIVKCFNIEALIQGSKDKIAQITPQYNAMGCNSQGSTVDCLALTSRLAVATAAYQTCVANKSPQVPTATPVASGSEGSSSGGTGGSSGSTKKTGGSGTTTTKSGSGTTGKGTGQTTSGGNSTGKPGTSTFNCKKTDADHRVPHLSCASGTYCNPADGQCTGPYVPDCDIKGGTCRSSCLGDETSLSPYQGVCWSNSSPKCCLPSDSSDYGGSYQYQGNPAGGGGGGGRMFVE